MNRVNDPDAHVEGAPSASAHESDQAETLEVSASTLRGRRASNQSALLMEMALDQYEFGVDTVGKPFALPHGGHVVRSLRGDRSGLRAELARQFYRQYNKIPSSNALSEVLSMLEFDCKATAPRQVSMRVARRGNHVYLDLGDPEERVVRITADGWEVLGRSAELPVLFRRTALTQPLPTPVQDGDLEQLWNFVNVTDENDRNVLRGWLVAAIMLVGLPCPVLGFLAEQGTAKTSAMKAVTALFDPTSAPVRRPPNDAEKLLHASHGSRVTAFDNLSHVPQWMSDALCRIVTGESDADRSLYTDDDQRVITVQGVLTFTGIDVGTLPADLAERCVWASPQVITPDRRRSERELNDLWREQYPSMVGGLFDLVAATLRKLPNVHLSEKPRMADFAEVLQALDLATGTNGLAHYIARQEAQAAEAVDHDVFLFALTTQIRARWEGSARELLASIRSNDSNDKTWPTSRSIRGRLLRAAPNLRKIGWLIEEQKYPEEAKRASSWVIEPPATAVSAEVDEVNPFAS